MPTEAESGRTLTTPNLQAASLEKLLPIRFRRDAAELARFDTGRGTRKAKQPKAYYLDGVTAVFQPGVSLPRPLGMDQKFSGAELLLLNPGPSAVEVRAIVDRFPEIKCLHIVESAETNIDAIRSELQKEIGDRELPEMAGYVADLRHLPEELAGRCDLVVEINVIDPKADKMFREDVLQQISRVLKLGGLFYSAGVTVRWTDKVLPLSLVAVPVRAKILKLAGYSDALRVRRST